MDVGTELREARQRTGLSQEEVSQRTKIQLPKIQALEANAFERLPDGIYLDGIIRAYATEVGLDGRELLSRFHDNHIVVVPSASAATDEFPSEEDEFPSEDEDTVAQAPLVKGDETLAMPPPPSEVGVVAAPAPAIAVVTDDVSYSAPPLRPDSGIFAAHASRPPRTRLSRLALPVIALLAAVAIGAYLSDRNRPFIEREDIATPAVSSGASGASGVSGDSAASAPPAPAAGAPPANTDAASATGTRLDRAERAATAKKGLDDETAAAKRAPSAPSAPSAPAPSAPASAAPSAPAPGAASAPPSGATSKRASSAPSAPSAPRSTSAPRAPNASSSPSPPVSGFWTLDTRVETSSVRDYEGLQLGYRLELQEDRGRITGRGIKTTENGRAIGTRGQTPITVVGRMEKNRLMLSFIESGIQRESAGKMILELNEDGVLRGRFSSDAARSTGTVEARRPEG